MARAADAADARADAVWPPHISQWRAGVGLFLGTVSILTSHLGEAAQPAAGAVRVNLTIDAAQKTHRIRQLDMGCHSDTGYTPQTSTGSFLLRSATIGAMLRFVSLIQGKFRYLSASACLADANAWLRH